MQGSRYTDRSLPVQVFGDITMETHSDSKRRTVVAQMEPAHHAGGGVSVLDTIGKTEPNCNQGAEPNQNLKQTQSNASQHLATDTRKLNGAGGVSPSSSCVGPNGKGSEGGVGAVLGGGGRPERNSTAVLLHPAAVPEAEQTKKGKVPMARSLKTDAASKLKSPNGKHTTATSPRTHTPRTEPTWDSSSKVDHSRTDHLSTVNPKPPASRTLQGSKDTQKCSSSKGSAVHLAPRASSSPKCRTTVAVTLTSTTSDVIKGGESESDLSMGSLGVNVTTPQNTPSLTPDPLAMGKRTTTKTILEDAARQLESKMATVTPSTVTITSQNNAPLLGGGMHGGPAPSQKAVQQTESAVTMLSTSERDINPTEHRRAVGRIHGDRTGRLSRETKAPGSPLGKPSHTGDGNVMAIASSNSDEALARASQKGGQDIGKKEKTDGHKPETLQLRGTGRSRVHMETGTMTNPGEVRHSWGEERREVGVQAVVEVCDRSSTTSPHLLPPSLRGNHGQEGVVANIDGQKETESQNQPAGPPLCCVPIGLPPFQHVCQIDIELCSQTEPPTSNNKMPTSKEKLPAGVPASVPAGVTNVSKQKPKETENKAKSKSGQAVKKNDTSGSKTSQKHRTHPSPAHSFSNRTNKNKQKPILDPKPEPNPATEKGTGIAKLTAENPDLAGKSDEERKVPEPVQNVVWDEQGMTWEVYGASLDLESLGFAIQSHLQCKIREHEKRIGTLRKSVSEDVPSPGEKKKEKKKKRNVFRSIFRPGCCSKPPASPAGK